MIAEFSFAYREDCEDVCRLLALEEDRLLALDVEESRLMPFLLLSDGERCSVPSDPTVDLEF